jgi:hypothetical protein
MTMGRARDCGASAPLGITQLGGDQPVTTSSQPADGRSGGARDRDPAPPSDVSWLRQEFPGWRIGTVWASVATGPDARRLTATRDGVLVTAWNAAALAADIRREERTGTSAGGQRGRGPGVRDQAPEK